MHTHHSDSPCVSVVVAAYNVESYIGQCLRSLKAQTLESIQIVVVDDGSTDATPDRIHELLCGEGHSVEYIRQQNGGLSAARNAGMAATRGRFIGFVDGDDWVDPAMFESLYNEAAATNSEVAVCAGRKRWPNGQQGRVSLRIPTADFGRGAADNPEILWGVHSYAWNKIYARDLVERESFEFPAGKLFEDSAVVYGLVARANRVVAVDEPLYQYRMGRPEAITQRADPRIFDIFDACDSLRDSLVEIEALPGGPEVVERLVRTHLFARLPVLRGSRSPLRAARFSLRTMSYLDTYFPDWRSRYRRGGQSWWRFSTRRSATLAVFASVLRPTGNIVRARLTTRSGATVGDDLMCAIAARRLDRAFRSASIPYTLDLSSLEQVYEHERLTGRLEVALLPGSYSSVDVAVVLRQQRFQLTRTYVHEEQCVAQRWRLSRRFLGKVIIELRFLEEASDGTVRTRFFFSDGQLKFGNRGSIAELRAGVPASVVDRSVPLAGTVRVVEPLDPFVGTRTSPEFHRPRDFEQLAATLPDVDIANDEGAYFDGMEPFAAETATLARVEQMEILRGLLEFCATNELEPMLGDGSLLGAVRHGGYIPWDDDIDLWLTRRDFDRLVSAQLPEGLDVLHHTTNRDFHLGLAKVVLVESGFTWSYPAGLEPSGANIDVFPLDWSGSPERLSERLRARLVRVLRQTIRTRYRFPESRRRTSRVLLGWLLPGYIWQRILHQVVTAPPLGRRTNLTSWFSAYSPYKASYPAPWIIPATRMEFEGEAVAAPSDPERVLTRTYGDYATLPHPSRRTTANHFLKLRGDHE